MNIDYKYFTRLDSTFDTERFQRCNLQVNILDRALDPVILEG